jgi:hypothetical protein
VKDDFWHPDCESKVAPNLPHDHRRRDVPDVDLDVTVTHHLYNLHGFVRPGRHVAVDEGRRQVPRRCLISFFFAAWGISFDDHRELCEE